MYYYFYICTSHVIQEYTIKQQLDCGVRYCDLRIAHRPNDSSTDLYFYHGVYTTLTVEVKCHTDVTGMFMILHSGLQQLSKNFASLSTNT